MNTRCFMISGGVWWVPCITLLHLSTQVRCAASDHRIWSRWDAPLVWGVSCGFALVVVAIWFSGSLLVRRPQLSVVPRVTGGQVWLLCGQVSRARSH